MGADAQTQTPVAGGEEGGALAALREGALAVMRRAENPRRFAAGVVCTGLHQSLCTALLLVGAFSSDAFSLLVVTAAAAFLLALNVLMHHCPLTVMEEEKWGYSGTALNMGVSEWLLGADAQKDAYTVQMQYIVACAAALAVRLLLMLAARCLEAPLAVARIFLGYRG